MEPTILKQHDILIVTVHSGLSDSDLTRMRDNLLGKARQFRTRGAVLDLSALDVLDSFACRSLQRTAQALRLEGTQAVVVGIRPDLALTMVRMGLSLEGIGVALDLDEVWTCWSTGLGGRLVPSDLAITICSEGDVVGARRQGRELAARIGFSTSDQAVIATAISELVRNIVQFAGRGEVLLGEIEDGGRRGLIVIARDKGPGIRDIAMAMQDGFSTADGLGLGLPGVKRLMDDFEIVSVVGKGTTVTAMKWLK